MQLLKSHSKKKLKKEEVANFVNGLKFVVKGFLIGGENFTTATLLLWDIIRCYFMQKVFFYSVFSPYKRFFIFCHDETGSYREFSHDVTAAMLVFQNKGMAAVMVYQTNPPGIELSFYANTFFCFSNPIWLPGP